MRSLSKNTKVQKQERKIKNIIYWCIVLIIVLYVLFGTRYSLITYWRVKRNNRHLQENLQKFARENEHLKENIDDLQNNPEALERIAREKANMQYEGETVIRFEITD